MTTVLINGVDSPLGVRVARELSAHPGLRVVGLGRGEPAGPVGHAEWLAARLSGAQLAELLRAAGVGCVVHLAIAGADGPAPSREAAVQQSVIGTMELLGACLAAGVGRVVVRSDSGVYGASPLNPALIGEDHPLAQGGLGGVLRDFAEVERICAEFAAHHPAIGIAMLRCAPLLGAWSPLADYLAQPGPPMLLGFDPMIQVLQLEDAARAFVLAASSTAAGAFNLAAADSVCLSQAIRLAGRQPALLLEPLVGLAAMLGDHSVARRWPYDLSFLRHSCVVDTRRACELLGWAPAQAAAEALRALAAPPPAEDPALAEAALRRFLER